MPYLDEKHLTVLITGGSGAIGSAVIDLLIRSGVRPVVYDLVESPVIKKFSGDYDFVKGDINDLGHIVENSKKYSVDKIIHLAAFLEESSPYRSLQTNCVGTFNILQAATLLNIQRMVYTSTIAVLGDPDEAHTYPKYVPIDETLPQRPTSFYGISKQFAELYCMKFSSSYALDCIILRFSGMYGLGRYMSGNPFAIMDRLVVEATLGKKVSIQVGGDAKSDWTYTRDAALAILMALEKKNPVHQVFHIGTGEGRTLKEAAHIVSRLVPDANITVGDGNDYRGVGHPTSMVLNIQRAKDELGYKPKYSMEKGIEDYFNSLNNRF